MWGTRVMLPGPACKRACWQGCEALLERTGAAGAGAAGAPPAAQPANGARPPPGGAAALEPLAAALAEAGDAAARGAVLAQRCEQALPQARRAWAPRLGPCLPSAWSQGLLRQPQLRCRRQSEFADMLAQSSPNMRAWPNSSWAV